VGARATACETFANRCWLHRGRGKASTESSPAQPSSSPAHASCRRPQASASRAPRESCDAQASRFRAQASGSCRLRNVLARDRGVRRVHCEDPRVQARNPDAHGFFRDAQPRRSRAAASFPCRGVKDLHVHRGSVDVQVRGTGCDLRDPAGARADQRPRRNEPDRAAPRRTGLSILIRRPQRNSLPPSRSNYTERAPGRAVA
jgi:hypothetical protein